MTQNESETISPNIEPPSVQPLRGPRAQRYVDFHAFLDSAFARFTDICQDNEESRRFDGTYGFCVTPGGRNGGLDKRILEVFFGQRPYDVQERYDSKMRRGLKVLAERGATLEYVQDDLGRVHCFLYPAASEGMKPLEDSIQLSTIPDPRVLNPDDRHIQRHFRRLLAYMQCTSLDGEPKLSDKFIVGWLRFVRPLGINGRMQVPKIRSSSLEILKFSLSVGLSGFLLSVVAWVFPHSGPQDVFIKGESPDVVKEQGLLVRELSKQSQLLETMQRNLAEIKDRLGRPTVSSSPQKAKINHAN